jgi:hypothetical protein
VAPPVDSHLCSQLSNCGSARQDGLITSMNGHLATHSVTWLPLPGEARAQWGCLCFCISAGQLEITERLKPGASMTLDFAHW